MILLLCFFFVSSNYMVPSVCDTADLICVSEGDYCTGDLGRRSYTGFFDCDGSDASQCRICNSVDLECPTSGICTKRIRSKNQTCDSNQHLFCKWEYNCHWTGYCYDDSEALPLRYAQQGEPCNPQRMNTDPSCNSQDCDCLGGGNNMLQCNAISGICDLADNLCSNDLDCLFGEFCLPQDTTTATPEPRRCVKAYTPTQREGALCLSDAQCGHLMRCWDPVPFETVPIFRTKICAKRYNQHEGRQCSNNGDCASGKCFAGLCSEPNRGTAGIACSDDADCGRGMECGCPDSNRAEQGGARMRCVPDAQNRANSYNRRSLTAWESYWRCLERERCVDDSTQVGSCGWEKCRSEIKGLETYSRGSVPTILRSKQKCEVPTLVGYPEYTGWMSTIEGGVSMVAPALALIISLNLMN